MAYARGMKLNRVQLTVVITIGLALAVTVPYVLALGLAVWLIGYLSTRSGTTYLRKQPSGRYTITADTGHVLVGNLSRAQAREYVRTGRVPRV